MFFSAAPRLAIVWWSLVALRGLLPAAFVVAMGVLVSAVQHGHSLAVVALVGENGAGKTTFVVARMPLGLDTQLEMRPAVGS